MITISFAASLFGIHPTVAAQESQPGLMAVYTSGETKIVAIVPDPNFHLEADQSIHPQVDPEFEAEWQGVLRISRAGRYHVFGVNDIQINGAPAKDWVTLPTGEHSLKIRFQRTTPQARLSLEWESEFFQSEPVPSSALGHIGTPDGIHAQNRIEDGRVLFAEMGCANCHAASNWNLQSRRGPDLAGTAARLDAAWINDWLQHPRNYRKAAVMPLCLDKDQDRQDVVAFLSSLGLDAQEAGAPEVKPEQIASGQELFERVGCTKCHDKANALTGVGSKYRTAEALTSFVEAPHARDPHGRMPQLFRAKEERHLAGAVAAYLHQTMKREKPYTAPSSGDVARGARLFATRGCASCHTLPGAAIDSQIVLTGPAFGKALGLPLRHLWDFESKTGDAVVDQVSDVKEIVSGQKNFVPGEGGRGHALAFDGRTFIEPGHFQRPDTMTITVWVKTKHGGSILTWGRAGGGQRGSREFRMNIGQDGANSICYGEYNSDGGWKPVIARPTDIQLTDDRWHHLAVVRKGQIVQHFVDGKAQGKPGQSQPGGGDYTDRLMIGALGLNQNPSNYFRGQMDDLAVWELALSEEQIAALATGQSPAAMAKPDSEELDAIDVTSGCLAPAVKSPLPNYELSDNNRAALQSFLTTVLPQDGKTYHEAPLTTLNLRIRQFRCTSCHELNHLNIQAAVKVDENGRILHVERPPLLTGAGAKLTAAWLQEVLVNGKRNRPWLNLRMPHFGESVRDVPQLVAAAAGVAPHEAAPKPDRNLAEAGLKMIGEQRGKASCVACHNYRGINRRKDGVVPAPDLAEAGRTVRQPWFLRWMHDPQRLRPGTSMPQMFLDVSSEERELRIAQLWSALVYQDQLPLPAGVLDQKTDGTRIIVGDQPVIFRMATQTPAGQIDRAINVGLPGGFNFTFDAVTCQLKYVWKGPFLDAGPAWNGRGGNPVKAGEPGLLTVNSGHVVRMGPSLDPESIRFRGYRLDGHMPVFRYKIDGIAIEHRIDVTASGVQQHFHVEGATADVYYLGDDANTFSVEGGTRDQSVVRFDAGKSVNISVAIPVKP